ncbi:MAG: alpha amylase family protein [Candidatus Marinimicrobia bacterium]|nr:alpha amylase family protein [Candidatus Neomarinimicrobiota bacterium]
MTWKSLGFRSIFWGLFIFSWGMCSFPQKAENWLWIDASANFERLSSEDSIRYYMKKIRQAGIEGIIVDLKPISGEVLYPSKIAPQVFEWRGFTREKTFDYPNLMIHYARENNLIVLASMNCFSEGWKQEKRGSIYTNHPEWQTMLYVPQGIIPTTDYSEGYAAFVNPALSDIQEYQFHLMEEILTLYDFDGIVLDRARYDNIRSDFSDESRKMFEMWLGNPVQNWPNDIFTWILDEKDKPTYKPGKYFKEWLLWRAQIIHDFFAEAQKRVKTVRPEAFFSVYVGAWYPSYYEVGVNWASKAYDPSKEYEWALPNYKKTGYAEFLDFLFTGCYFYPVTIAEMESLYVSWKQNPNKEPAMEEQFKPYHSVEGAAKLSKKVTMGKIPVYGSVYVQQYKDENNPYQFVKAMHMIHRETDGLMVFDLVHICEFDWWNELAHGTK